MSRTKGELRNPPARDHWERVRERLRRRKLFTFALVVLAFFYGTAIYAPLIANDRPYALEAIDYGGYEAARKKIYIATLGLDNVLEKTPSQYMEGRTTGSTQSYGDALWSEHQALVNAVATMKRYLPEEDHPPLTDFVDDVARAVELGVDERRQEASRLVFELRADAKELRTRYRAARPDQDPSTSGVLLRPDRSYPLFASLTAVEVFFMVLWWFVVLSLGRSFFARPSKRIRPARRWGWVLPLGTSLLCGAVWWMSIGADETSYYPEYKSGLAEGDLVAQFVVFPPIAMGFAETSTELNHPPSWHASPVTAEEEVGSAGSRGNSHFRPLLGTDGLGRDLLVRSIYGARISLSVGLVSTAILAVIGVLAGALAGYFGGRVDLLISRLIEVVICFPVFFLILGVVVFVGQSLLTIMIVVGLFRWTGIARLTRAEFLRLKELDFVVAAKALGLSTPRILLRHMLPNAISPLLVAATFSVAAGLSIESALSFLGFGVREPIPSWGGLVRSSLNPAHWWIQVFPGLLIFMTVLCYNLVGDAIRDAMDPRLPR
ncbi:MAG: hypothetical protein CMJ89_17970 [Planctomycetes bacterium]|nr:hypothetical protein [Planctomycetota bacterium]